MPDRSEEDLPALAPDRSAGQIERRASHGTGHVVEGQPVTPKRQLRHFDRDLVGPRTHELDLGNLWDGREIVPNPLGQRLQGELVRLTGDGHVDHLIARQHLADDRLLGFFRERIDGIDAVLDVVEHGPRVGTELDLDQHRAHALGRGGCDLLDPVDALDRLLDPDADGFFDLLRCRAQIRHFDIHHVEREFGEGLSPDVK